MLKSILLTAATSALLLTTAAHAGVITALDPFVREVPPGAPATAAFMTLHNTSDSPVRLIDADNDLTTHTEMHNHVDVDGVMQMRQIEHIDVPANGDVSLAPGGLHLMMIGLEGAVSEGDEVALTLTFDNGETLDITAPVRAIMPMSH
ncbi:MAG: copper chaperone PCu(A)C [Pseudomonadota bacterium]